MICSIGFFFFFLLCLKNRSFIVNIILICHFSFVMFMSLVFCIVYTDIFVFCFFIILSFFDWFLVFCWFGLIYCLWWLLLDIFLSFFLFFYVKTQRWSKWPLHSSNSILFWVLDFLVVWLLFGHSANWSKNKKKFFFSCVE